MREDHNRPSLVRRVGFEERGILSDRNRDKFEVVRKDSAPISIGCRQLNGASHEIKSATMDPYPKNLVYAETYPRCGEGIQLTDLAFALGSQG